MKSYKQHFASSPCILLLLLVLVLSSLAPAYSQGNKKDRSGLLLDMADFYTDAGLLAPKGPIPFVGDLFFLNGPVDSTTAFLIISLSNSQFQFLKTENGFKASYEVALFFIQKSGSISFKKYWTKEIIVESTQETNLTQETVLFQASTNILPGKYNFRVELKDLNSGHFSEASGKVKVANFHKGKFGLSQPIFLNSSYTQDHGFVDRIGRQVDLVTNPRRIFKYASGEIKYYLEFYGDVEKILSGLTLDIESSNGKKSRRLIRTEQLPDFSGRLSLTGQIPIDTLSVGPHEIKFTAKEANGKKLAEVNQKVIISLSEEWFTYNWQEAIDYLRYVASAKESEDLRNALPGDRFNSWNEFWRKRDPDPSTPVNEELVDYFKRIRFTNEHFSSKQLPGWLTDRGRVYMYLGPADRTQEVDLRTGIHNQEVWAYDISLGFQLVLLFEGLYPGARRLSFASERNFQVALQRLGKI